MKQSVRIPKPSFDEEKLLWQQGYRFIAGIDEVGRGAFAGPVVAAAVIFAPCVPDCTKVRPCTRCDLNQMKQIHDSKLLPAAKREKLASFIQETALAHSIAEIPVSYINKHGIGKAGQLAFRQAVASSMYHVASMENIEWKHATNYMLHATKTFVLVDGFPIAGVKKEFQKHIVKGDRLSRSIAAASIIAKVYRDNLMKNLSDKYAQYGFDIHKGYGTKKHREMITMYGLSNLHRTSFDLLKYVNP